MKVCIIGDGLVSLSLAKVLIQKGLLVDIYVDNKLRKYNLDHEIFQNFNFSQRTCRIGLCIILSNHQGFPFSRSCNAISFKLKSLNQVFNSNFAAMTHHGSQKNTHFSLNKYLLYSLN